MVFSTPAAQPGTLKPPEPATFTSVSNPARAVVDGEGTTSDGAPFTPSPPNQVTRYGASSTWPIKSSATGPWNGAPMSWPRVPKKPPHAAKKPMPTGALSA